MNERAGTLFFRYRLATLATAATLPSKEPRTVASVATVARPNDHSEALRTEVSQMSRVSQRHLPEQRSARLPRQMAPQRGRP